MKKIIYIAHPIGGNVKANLNKLSKIYREITATNNDVIPFIPYYVTVVSLNDTSNIERKIGFDHNKTIFNSGIINELWLYGDRISDGMKIEIEWAKELGIPIVSKTPETSITLEESKNKY